MTGTRESDDRRLGDVLEYLDSREYETSFGMMLCDDRVDHDDHAERVDNHEHVSEGGRPV